MLPYAEIRVRDGGRDAVWPLPFGDGGRMRILLLCSVFTGLIRCGGVALQAARCGHPRRCDSPDLPAALDRDVLSRVAEAAGRGGLGDAPVT
jgi:hypothetical protein